MSIFDSLFHYANNWEVTETRSFTEEEINAVDQALVVNSNYGLSVCFFMFGGGKTFIPLSRDSELTAGDRVNLKQAKLLTLSREGEDDILRVQI